jgi:hypothetical protein
MSLVYLYDWNYLLLYGGGGSVVRNENENALLFSLLSTPCGVRAAHPFYSLQCVRTLNESITVY